MVQVFVTQDDVHQTADIQLKSGWVYTMMGDVPGCGVVRGNDWTTIETAWLLIKEQSGLVYKVNKKGLRTYPRGSPNERADGSDDKSLKSAGWVTS